MSGQRPKLRVLLDEGVPAPVGVVFEKHGHELLPFDEVVSRGSADEVVAVAALANDAVLVACDRDMKQLAKKHGVSNDRFKSLNLIRFKCPSTSAEHRIEHAMSLIEHEWQISTEKRARRLWVEIGKETITTKR